ncbi:transposable element Tcb1 transposase [Trichonephila clavipes]|nr:transposable element Tcb1 transposase [Trichonephila clavipes]
MRICDLWKQMGTTERRGRLHPPSAPLHGMGWYRIPPARSPLVRIAGTLNSQHYNIEMLEPVALPYLQSLSTALFQQDNAGPHVARIVFSIFFVNHQIELLPLRLDLRIFRR